MQGEEPRTLALNELVAELPLQLTVFAAANDGSERRRFVERVDLSGDETIVGNPQIRAEGRVLGILYQVLLQEAPVRSEDGLDHVLGNARTFVGEVAQNDEAIVRVGAHSGDESPTSSTGE